MICFIRDVLQPLRSNTQIKMLLRKEISTFRDFTMAPFFAENKKINLRQTVSKTKISSYQKQENERIIYG